MLTAAVGSERKKRKKGDSHGYKKGKEEFDPSERKDELLLLSTRWGDKRRSQTN